MAIPSMSRLGALKISLENDLVHIYAKWGSSSSLRMDISCYFSLKFGKELNLPKWQPHK